MKLKKDEVFKIPTAFRTERVAPGGSIYGPLNRSNLYLRPNLVKEIEVPKGYKAVFSPTIDPSVAYSQAFCVYSVDVGNETFTKVIDGASNEEETPFNNSDHTATYYLTGWYSKYRDEWHQSNLKFSNQGGVLTARFDDGFDDRDFNDIVVTVKITD